MTEPITASFSILESILVLVSVNEFPNHGIRDIGPHSHNVANEIPTTMTWPTNAGNLAIASGIEITS